MEFGGKFSCSIDGRSFSQGELVCDDKRCYRCEGGEWKGRFIDDVYGVGP
ncbi:MAG: hypothetical protein HPY84_13730 [Syntrophobacteraceae bacterium]|nr:hypothetical protein [Syntrophobacteraceae bacterium]